MGLESMIKGGVPIYGYSMTHESSLVLGRNTGNRGVMAKRWRTKT